MLEQLQHASLQQPHRKIIPVSPHPQRFGCSVAQQQFLQAYAGVQSYRQKQGFGPEVKKTIAQVRSKAQPANVLLVSATMTKAVKKLVAEELPGLVTLQTGSMHRAVAGSKHAFVSLERGQDKLSMLQDVIQVGRVVWSFSTRCAVKYCSLRMWCVRVDELPGLVTLQTGSMHRAVAGSKHVFVSLERGQDKLYMLQDVIQVSTVSCRWSVWSNDALHQYQFWGLVYLSMMLPGEDEVSMTNIVLLLFLTMLLSCTLLCHTAGTCAACLQGAGCPMQ